MKDVYQDVCRLVQQSCFAPNSLMPVVASGGEENYEQRLSITFDIFGEQMPVVHCSAAFKTLISSVCIGLNLADMACEPDMFELYVQMELQLYSDDDTRTDTVQTELTFRFPCSTGPPVEVCAICSRDPVLSQEPYMTIIMQGAQIIPCDIGKTTVICL